MKELRISSWSRNLTFMKQTQVIKRKLPVVVMNTNCLCPPSLSVKPNYPGDSLHCLRSRGILLFSDVSGFCKFFWF